jgi:hypothetical protein
MKLKIPKNPLPIDWNTPNKPPIERDVRIYSADQIARAELRLAAQYDRDYWWGYDRACQLLD